MDITANITGIKYKIFLQEKLKNINIKDFNINECPAYCTVENGNIKFAKIFKYIFIIIFSFVLNSCSAIFLDTEYKNELGNSKFLLENENFYIEIDITDYGESHLSAGPLFLPIVPLSFPPFRGASQFGLLIKVINKENSYIKHISNVKVYNEKAKEVKHFDRNTKYNRLYISKKNEEISLPPIEHIRWYDSSFSGSEIYNHIYFDTLIYNKLSKLYESRKDFNSIGLNKIAGDQRYICYFKTNKKLKEITLEIKYINNDGYEVILPPLKYKVKYNRKYYWQAMV